MSRCLLATAAVLEAVLLIDASAQQGRSPFHDYRGDRPGVVHRITLADLPAPYATPHVQNSPNPLTSRPDGALPTAPDGYAVSLFATGLEGDVSTKHNRPPRATEPGCGAEPHVRRTPS